MIGTVGDYCIDHELGAGGFGTVYRAKDGSGRAVALKILHAELADSGDAPARFAREIEALGRLDHPSIVRVFGAGVAADGRPYYAMELLEGEELSARLAARGRLPVAEVLAILEPVCDALAAAHARGIVHRDIKASNVFLRAGGGVALLDFGIAKVGGLPGASLTLSRQILGTPAAMSPEQIRGGPVDARSDVYGLGALVFHMLTGEPPFDGGSATVVQQLHQHARRQRPSERAPVPPEIDRAVVRAMSVAPADRHAGAADFFADLQAAATGRARRPAKVRRAVVAVLAFAPGRGAEAAELSELARARETWCERLQAADFQVVARLGRGAVCARAVAGDADEAEARAAAETAAAGLAALGAGELAVRAGEVEIAGGRFVGGPALAEASP